MLAKNEEYIMQIKIFELLIIFTIAVTSGFAQDLTGPQIIEEVNNLMAPKTAYAKSKMTIVTTSGDLRTFVYDSWSKDKGEKNLVRYLEPRRVKDQAVLMLNHADDIWMYFPRTQRVRKMATHAKKQKMQGSDFSYEDMGSGDAFIEDFTAKRLDDEEKEGQQCFTLELTRKRDSDLSYSRLIMWVVKENFYPIVINYYSETNPSRLEKTLTQSNIEIIDGIATAKNMVMLNKNDNTKTEMELIEVTYDLELEDRMFSERELKK
jgi:outer membrane lipoprotein-sorting protein